MRYLLYFLFILCVNFIFCQTGNVGIGTTEPMAKLDINGNGAIRNNNFLEFGATISGKENNAGKIGYNLFSSDALDIVGAGTVYPKRNVKIFDRLYFENLLANRKIVLWQYGNNDHHFYGLGLEDGTMRFQIPAAENMYKFYAGYEDVAGFPQSKLLVEFQGSGNHLFYGANGDQSFKIDAYGNAEVTNKLGVNTVPDANHPLKVNSFSTTGLYTSNGWLHSSDKNLKTNINTLSNSLEKILKLRGVSFNWKKSPNEIPQVGFIAQEVLPFFPEVVNVDDEGNHSMAYQNLFAPIVEAIKELKNEIDLKSQEINNLKKENEILKSEFQKRIQALESKI
jgi:hypothetical protein